MNAALALAVGIVRTWVALYTVGLPRDLCEARRSEIDCDLWEQQWLASLRAEPGLRTAGEIVTRTFFGLLDDIVWRLETGASSRTKGTSTLNNTLPMRMGFLVLSLPLLAILLNGIGMLLGGGEFDSREEQLIYGFGLVALPTLAITGIWLSRARPLPGVALTAIGVVGVCLALFWMAVITVPIAIVIVAFSALRGGLIRLPASHPRVV